MTSRWTFEWISNNKMSDIDLAAYQRKLLQIRDKFENKFAQFPECKFYPRESQLPPADNIFATFKYDCNRHVSPRCQGKTFLK